MNILLSVKVYFFKFKYVGMVLETIAQFDTYKNSRLVLTRKETSVGSIGFL